jgi:hypothetical protein
LIRAFDGVFVCSQKIASSLPPSDIAFTTNGTTPINGWSKAKRQIEDALTQAKEQLTAWTVHDIRRLVATGLQRLDTSLQTIEAVLGHVSGSRRGVVGIYQRHSFDAEKRAALEAWGAHVMALLEDKKADKARGCRDAERVVRDKNEASTKLIADLERAWGKTRRNKL